jgi:hypothetical protein
MLLLKHGIWTCTNIASQVLNFVAFSFLLARFCDVGLTMPKALILVADGSEEIEFVTPYDGEWTL